MFRIFISYRRQDSTGYAHAIYQKLAQHFRKDQIFMDVDTIEHGANFKQASLKAANECDVLIALIGQRWATGGSVASRIDDPEDLVRLEISTALARNISVIPVLVDGMTIPSEDTLPGPLKPLSYLNGIVISQTHFQDDLEHVDKTVSKLIDAPGNRLKKIKPYAYAVGIIAILVTSALWLIDYPSHPILQDVPVAPSSKEESSPPKPPTPPAAPTKGEATRAKSVPATPTDTSDATRYHDAKDPVRAENGESSPPKLPTAPSASTKDQAARTKSPPVFPSTDTPDATGSHDKDPARAENGELQAAIENYTQAIHLNPNNARAYFERGNVYHKKGDLDRALRDIDMALRLNPIYSDAFRVRADIYRLKGDLDRAGLEITKSLRLNSYSADSFRVRAAIRRARGAISDAEQDERTARQLEDSQRK